MASVLNISISGKDASQRLLKVLEEGQVVRIGRTAKQGWEIPWDKMISRDHADVSWVNGGLRVQCLPQAQNPVIHCGKPVREATVTINEWFQIGGTTFHISSRVELSEKKPVASAPQQVEFCHEENSEGTERAYSAADLRKVSFGNSDRQMELLEQLPEKISGSHSDDDLGTMLSHLLLEAIPNSLAVAVAHFDETELPADVSLIDQFPKPLSMRVQTREYFEGRFVPSPQVSEPV
ncbi:MAG: FHA domain-containing protein [Planctomycetota bacterium]